jgi:hypothetical protein
MPWGSQRTKESPFRQPRREKITLRQLPAFAIMLMPLGHQSTTGDAMEVTTWSGDPPHGVHGFS